MSIIFLRKHCSSTIGRLGLFFHTVDIPIENVAMKKNLLIGTFRPAKQTAAEMMAIMPRFGISCHGALSIKFAEG